MQIYQLWEVLFPNLHTSPVCPSLPAIFSLKRWCRNGIFRDLPVLGYSLGDWRGRTAEILRSSSLLQLNYKKLYKESASLLGLIASCKTRWEPTSRDQSIGLENQVLLMLGGKGRNADFCWAGCTFRGRGILKNAIMLPKPSGCNGQVGLLQVWVALEWGMCVTMPAGLRKGRWEYLEMPNIHLVGGSESALPSGRKV